MIKMEGAIEFTEEQGMISDSAVSFFREQYPMATVRQLLDDERGYTTDGWRSIGELGWLGMMIPEEFGGAGLSAKELVSVVEPMGRHLVGTPFIATTLAGQLLLKAGSEAQKSRLLPKLASGAAIGSVALFEPHGAWEPDQLRATAQRSGNGFVLSGSKAFVLDAAVADLVIVACQLDGAPALFCLSGPQLQGRLRRETVIDETRRSHRLQLDGLEVGSDAQLTGGDALAALKWCHALGALLHTAESAGGANSALLLTVDYLKTRKQFGQLIGSYQALKHPTVDAMIAVEHSRSHLYYAASLFNGYDGGESEVAVRMAKVHSNESFYFASDRAIQFHGGMGFTHECNAGLHFRRAQWNKFSFGDTLHHRRHLRRLLMP